MDVKDEADGSILDSATALARSPLFALLGRVELAKLAGELEDVDFEANTFLVREGDPGDALYVIRSGTVRVFTGAGTSANSAPVLLSAGEMIGEMALLTGAPRSASVVAQARVETWRLGADRFLALLARERPIAESIEQTLSQRLASTTRQATDYRHQGHELARLSLQSVTPAAARLLGLLALRPNWPIDTIARACQQAGDDDALRELERTDVLLRRQGTEFVVPSLIAEAVRGGISTEQRLGWAEALSRADPSFNVGTNLLLDGGTAGDRSTGETTGRIPPAAHPTALHIVEDDAVESGRQNSQRSVSWLRLTGLLMASAIYAFGWFAPLPEGLSRAGLVTLGAITATLPLFFFEVLPNHGVALALAAALAIPAVTQPRQVLAGFGTSTWLQILGLFAISATLAQSGLLFRAALKSLERLPANFVIQTLVISLVGLGLSAGIASRTARSAMAAPAAREVADALRFAKNSPEAAALGLIAYLGFGEISTVFVTGSTISLLLRGMLPEPWHTQSTFGAWFVAASIPNLLLFVMAYAAIFLLYRPRVHIPVDYRKVQTQLQLLGPLARGEKISLAVLVVLVGGFVTESYHGIDPAWLTAGVVVILLLVNALDEATFRTGAQLGQLIYMGILLGLGPLFVQLKIDTWLTAVLRTALPGQTADPMLFILLLALAAFAVHFVVPFNIASPLLALVAIPFAIAYGFNPLAAILVILIAGDHAFLPTLSQPFQVMLAGTKGTLFSQAQARPLLRLSALARLVAVVASVPIWRALGLM